MPCHQKSYFLMFLICFLILSVIKRISFPDFSFQFSNQIWIAEQMFRVDEIKYGIFVEMKTTVFNVYYEDGDTFVDVKSKHFSMPISSLVCCHNSIPIFINRYVLYQLILMPKFIIWISFFNVLLPFNLNLIIN